MFTASNAVNQAVTTADHYMQGAIDKIDRAFGDGYAEKHPELVAVFMEVCAADFNTAAMSGAID